MPLNVDAAMDFVYFVEERHRVWERRQAGEPQPWTTDPILASRKFTNVFRILDPGTQYIMTDLIDPNLEPREQLMRLFLYRHTGRVEFWQNVILLYGVPEINDLRKLGEHWAMYRDTKKVPVFTGAYLVFPQSQTPGTDKLASIFDLTARLFTPGSPQDVMPDWLTASSQEERFNVLRRNKGVADFMSMQILTDWGYTPHSGAGPDTEDEFVVLGPGALKGAKALDPTARPDDIHRWAVRAVRESEDCPRLRIDDRRFALPSFMDIQNTLCEFSKRVRWAEKPAEAPLYRAAHPGPQTPPTLPEHW